MRHIAYLLFAFLFSSNIIGAQETVNLFGNLNLGPYTLGFKQLTISDTTEIEAKEISIRLWYPAIENGQNLNFADYMDYKNELNKPELLQNLAAGIGASKEDFPQDSLTLILNAKMGAIKNAEAKTGQFPLLVWSIRYGTVEYQNIISEYISSHGYVVAFLEDIPSSPYPWQIQSAIEKADALDQQISYLNSSIEFLKHQNYIDSTKIGLLSWSYAGESAILTQINNPDIDLVVGLSSIGFSNGVYLGNKLSDRVDIEKMNVPYLMLFEKVAPNGNTRTLPTLFDSMHVNSRYVSFNKLAHGNFNVIEGMIPGILRTSKVQSWSRGGQIAQIGYEVICILTISFLEAVFNDSNFDSFDTHSAALQKNLPKGFFDIFLPKKE